jgi:POT family proton-dependent oligopeptide transporter
VEPAVFGHPRGLATLFMTEMWERFTYYGMRAILLLYLVAAIKDGGLGIDDKTGSAIYGLYISGTYLFSLLGGYIADRIIGAQRAGWFGGIFIMIGNAMLAFGQTQLFFCGLMLIVAGVGLLKPNISAIVAQLYPEGGSRRDAGFSIFYMGINRGAAIGSFLVPEVAQSFGWGMGFALPAVGMALGLVQFTLTRKYLGTAGVEGGAVASNGRASWTPIAIGVAIVVLVVGLSINGVLHLDAVAISNSMSWVIFAFALFYFLYLGFFAGLSLEERKRVIVMFVLFVACAMFWAGFEQAGASLNLFADRHMNRMLGGFEIPTGWFQSVNSAFIIIFAPLVSMFWLWLARRGIELAPSGKFVIGLMGSEDCSSDKSRDRITKAGRQKFLRDDIASPGDGHYYETSSIGSAINGIAKQTGNVTTCLVNDKKN